MSREEAATTAMKPRMLFGTIAFFLLVSLMSCAGVNNEIVTKQREGISYPVPYQTALQITLFTLTKKGIAINTIDRENGLITTLPQQIREEKYVYQIVLRPVGSSETAIVVMCNWTVAPGLDIAFAGIPSAIAKSKSRNLEIEMAGEIQKEMEKINLTRPQ